MVPFARYKPFPGTLDLTPFEHRRFPLARVNEAIAALKNTDGGGLANFIVTP